MKDVGFVQGSLQRKLTTKEQKSKLSFILDSYQSNDQHDPDQDEENAAGNNKNIKIIDRNGILNQYDKNDKKKKTKPPQLGFRTDSSIIDDPDNTNKDDPKKKKDKKKSKDRRKDRSSNKPNDRPSIVILGDNYQD